MDFLLIIVVGVLVVAWILGAIAEQQRRANQTPPPLPSGTEGRAPARPREELTEFLKELRRKAAAEANRPLEAELVEEPRRAPLPPKPERREEPKKKPVSPTRSIPPQEKSSAATIVRQKSAASVDVVELLRSPSNLAAAIVLQEILGPPRCRRRR